MRETQQTVTVALAGGLGNQLFQAAAGLALARRTHSRLQFDLAFFATKKNQSYQLACFEHGAELVTYGRLRRPNAAKRLIAKLGGKAAVPQVKGFTGAVYEQPGFDFDPAFDSLKPSCHLTGFFQSERYFAGNADEVRKLFDPAHGARRNDEKLAGLVAGEQSVAIHVRRGDYLSSAKVRAVHGLVGAEYYEQALARMRTQLESPQFLVFSDEPASARALLGTNASMTYIEDGSAFDDLQLMRRCRHHIIANSSFSWWGAYFDGRAGGTTIAPRQWFTESALASRSIADLFPPGWVTL